MIPLTSDSVPSVVLAGLESAGKSALFRGLTGHATGDEANFRGSTVVCRRCRLPGCHCEIVDTPGIRTASDAETTRLALEAARAADVVLLVVRGTHLARELEELLGGLNVQGRLSAVAVTFKDKLPLGAANLVRQYQRVLQVPVVLVNARQLGDGERQQLLRAIEKAAPPVTGRTLPEAPVTVVDPPSTWLEHPLAGPWLALLLMGAMFAGPVYLAYVFAAWLQPLADAAVIAPVKQFLGFLPALGQALLTGGYGLITLGWYSFLWAFPVVLLVSMSVAVVEETGLKDRMVAALDPWLRRMGLDGRDLIPVLTGFGCNVVAVFQSRACSACARKSCVSLISFGSACSYQIGASLSVFGASGRPWLFLPLLGLLFLIGAGHTRLWHGGSRSSPVLLRHERSFLQLPSARALGWRVRASLKQFLLQAMPVFLGICVVAALLDFTGAIVWLAACLAPVMSVLGLPSEAAPAVLFSVLRKDGLLALNSGGGSLVQSMSPGELFLVVWFASTFSACLVTLWTVRSELGWRTALKLAAGQAVTSLITTALMGRAVLVLRL